MCGIAGILYKDTDLDLALGRDLITMLDGCQHRGPDSTGFALYHESNGDNELRLRFFVGEGEQAEETVERIRAKHARGRNHGEQKNRFQWMAHGDCRR